MQRYSPLLSRDTPPMCKVRRRGGFLFDRTTSKACWDLFPRLIDYISKMALLRENERRSDIFGRAAPSYRTISMNIMSCRHTMLVLPCHRALQSEPGQILHLAKVTFKRGHGETAILKGTLKGDTLFLDTAADAATVQGRVFGKLRG
eukprot:s50_g35.t1